MDHLDKPARKDIREKEDPWVQLETKVLLEHRVLPDQVASKELPVRKVKRVRREHREKLASVEFQEIKVSPVHVARKVCLAQ